jgi:hypothetical protein
MEGAKMLTMLVGAILGLIIVLVVAWLKGLWEDYFDNG